MRSKPVGETCFYTVLNDFAASVWAALRAGIRLTTLAVTITDTAGIQ
jgi:hypothetical protein